MLDVISVTWGHTYELMMHVACWRLQTSDDWRLHVVHDGPNPELRRECMQRGLIDGRQTFFHETHERHNDHGHSLRAWALRELVTGDHVLLTNVDNYYVPVCVEQIEKRTEEFIWWDLIHNYDTPINHNESSYGLMQARLKHGCIDMGAVAVDARLARHVGFRGRTEDADWTYFEQCLSRHPTVHKINKVLTVHN